MPHHGLGGFVMMEYEELLRARAYVEALAEGRDPESGETLSLADARCAE